MPEVGALALWLALLTALYGAAMGAVAAVGRREDVLASARAAVWVVAALVTLNLGGFVVCVGLLAYALYSHDFRLAFVADNNSRETPTFYTLVGLWGGQAGSLLFWTWLLSLYTVSAVGHRRPALEELQPAALSVLLAIAAFFLLLLTIAENPFALLPEPVADGRGLNPLLEDPGMLIHPPLLYMGFVGFAVPFAFAMAALVHRRVDAAWLSYTRGWTLLAWYTLGAGLVLGGWWAYRVLGWGGYWGWDPVENSALVPWLVATALIHSVIVQEQRDMLKGWNVTLVVLAFALSVLGAFLTRTGLLVSVHTFAQSGIAPYFLGFLAAVLVGPTALLVWRLEDLRARHELEAVLSREGTFLLNTLVFLAAAVVVLMGTLFPIVTEVVQGIRILIGPPYFRQVFAPIALGLLALMGIGPLLPWRRTSRRVLVRQLRWPLVAGAGVAVSATILGASAGVAAAAVVIGFTAAAIVQEFHRGARSRVQRWGEPYPRALLALLGRQRRRYGGYLVHAAVLVIAVGVVGSQAFVTEREGVLATGERLEVGRYTLIYRGTEQEPAPNATVTIAAVDVLNEGHPAGRLTPRRRYYPRYNQPVYPPAIRSTWREDLYVVFLGLVDDGRASFRVWVNPLVRLIWLGGALFTLGTLVAAWPDRRRRIRTAVEARRQAVLQRIRELDLDFGAGKLSEEDYRRLRDEAVAEAAAFLGTEAER